MSSSYVLWNALINLKLVQMLFKSVACNINKIEYKLILLPQVFVNWVDDREAYK